MQVQSLGQEDTLEKEMATTPVSLPGESPGTEELGGLQTRGSQRVRHNRSDLPHTNTYIHIYTGTLFCVLEYLG